MISRIETYGKLLQYLQNHPEILEQKIQVMANDYDERGENCLHSVICIGTIQDLCHDEENENALERTRSSYDNKHHPEDVVFLSDINPFGIDGEIGCDLLTGEKIYPKK